MRTMILMIPNNLSVIKYGIFAVVIVAIIFATYRAGQTSIQTKWDLEKAEIKEKIVIQKVIEEKVTEKVVTKYVDRIKIVKEKGDTIVQYIPQYITSEDNSNCTVPVGFTRLWNSAIQNQLPGDPAETDRADAGVTLTDIASNHAINTTTCLIYKERALAWEQWATEQKAANK